MAAATVTLHCPHAYAPCSHLLQLQEIGDRSHRAKLFKRWCERPDASGRWRKHPSLCDTTAGNLNTTSHRRKGTAPWQQIAKKHAA